MTPKKLRAVHYLNQFFGQEGKEEKADISFLLKEGPVGPGTALQKILGERAEVVATLICGDNHFAQDPDRAAEEGLKRIIPYAPDLFFAGPAFAAGRYGIACGAICKIVEEELRIPAVTGMHEENPGVELYRRHAYICKSQKSTVKMADDLARMAALALKLISPQGDMRLVSQENLGDPEADGFFSRRRIRNIYAEKTQAERGVEMLLAKLNGRPFQTETELPRFKRASSPRPLKDLRDCEIALVSDGGLTKKGNPDRFSGRGDNGWAAYPVAAFFPEEGPPEDLDIVHTGYSPVHVFADTNRLVPVDVLREMEKKGIIGKFHPFFYSTSGNAVSLHCARKLGAEIAAALKERRVDAAILTST